MRMAGFTKAKTSTTFPARFKLSSSTLATINDGTRADEKF